MKKRDLLREVFGAHAAADESYNNPFDRTLRGLIEEINAEGGVICSSARHGYWWAASLADGLSAAEANMGRALTQLENSKRLVDNLKREFGGQLSMEM